MYCKFISIYGKFVTSQTVSFSRADNSITTLLGNLMAAQVMTGKFLYFLRFFLQLMKVATNIHYMTTCQNIGCEWA